MDPVLHNNDILDYPDEAAEKVAMEIFYACQLSRDNPDAAFESVSNFEFDDSIFDNFAAEYIANESISTNWGKLINFEKEIKMAVNAMSKSAGAGINLLPGTDGFTTSAPRKKDGQYYTRATAAFSDGQAVRILFYSPDKPEEKPKYPTNVVSFQVFLNKKDITASLVRGGGKDYGPRKFGKIIGKLLERNSEKFQEKNAEIRVQKEEMEAIDREMSSLDKQITSKSSSVKQSQEKNVSLKKQHADLKQKAETAKAEKKKKAVAEVKPKLADTDAEIQAIGKANITDIGNENVYVEKEDGTRYYFKPGNPDLFDVGEHDFSNEIVFNDGTGKTEIETGGEVETTSPRDELKRLLTEELKQLKADPDTPEFKLGLRIGKKKDGSAGKVSLDLKEADVATLEELDYLKLAINNRVSAHTDNYELKSDKVAAFISESETEIIEERDGRQYKIFYVSPEPLVKVPGGHYGLSITGPVGAGFTESAITTKTKDEMVTRVEKIIENRGETVGRRFTTGDGQPEHVEDWHTEDVPSKGHAVVEGEGAFETLDRVAKDAVGAITKNQEIGGEPLYAYLLPSTASENGIVRLFPDDQKKPAGWERLGNEAFRANVQNKDQIEVKLKELLRNAPIIATGVIEEPQQEQVEGSEVTQAEIPPEEKAANGRDIGQEFKDREGIKKLVTHEIDGNTVSAIQQKEYVLSAYLRGRTWINLPTEQKTLISEADLKGAIAKSEEAYQIADDILDGNYDTQGHEKVDQLLDEIAEVIQDESKLMEVADHLTKLITEKFTASQTAVPA